MGSLRMWSSSISAPEMASRHYEGGVRSHRLASADGDLDLESLRGHQQRIWTTCDRFVTSRSPLRHRPERNECLDGDASVGLAGGFVEFQFTDWTGPQKSEHFPAKLVRTLCISRR